MIYWVSYYYKGDWIIVLETEDESEAFNKKEELEKEHKCVMIDYDS